MNSPDDLAALDGLMTRAGQQDDQAAFAQLIEATHHLVRASILRQVGHIELADEIAQEVMVRAWQSRAQYRPGTNPRAWLLAIARSQVMNLHRQVLHPYLAFTGEFLHRVWFLHSRWQVQHRSLFHLGIHNALAIGHRARQRIPSIGNVGKNRLQSPPLRRSGLRQRVTMRQDSTESRQQNQRAYQSEKLRAELLVFRGIHGCQEVCNPF